jgi:RND family efflux transporter MFP subunit
MSRTTFYVGLGGLAIAAAGFSAFVSRPSAELGYRSLETVGSAPVERTLIASGLVKPAVTLDVRAEISGLVDAVLVKEGDRVSAGQVLVKLDNRVAASQLEEAEAHLRQVQLQDSAAELDVDDGALELKRNSYNRAKAMFDKGLISRDALEAKQLEVTVAERALERHRRGRASSRAAVAEARANLARAQAQLDHTVVRAPFDAHVLRRLIDVGAGVSAVGQSAAGGTVLLTLGDAKRSAFYARVTAADAEQLRPGLTARIRIDAGEARTLTGVVKTVSTAGEVDDKSRLSTFPIVVALANVPNTWVNVPSQAEIVLGQETQAIVVSHRCVWTDQDGASYALMNTPEGPVRREIQLGAVQPDRMQVRGGLERGEVVICR